MSTGRRVLIVFVIIFAVLGIVINSVIIYFAWSLNTPITKGGQAVLEVGITALDTVTQISDSASEALSRVREPVDKVVQAGNELSSSVADSGLILTLLPQDLADRLSAGIEQVQTTLQSLVNVVVSANDTLVSLNDLPFVSVPTLQDTDLPQKLDDLQTSMAQLENDVQQFRQSASGEIDRFVQNVNNVSTQISDWENQLTDLSTRAESLQAQLSDLQNRIAMLVDIFSLLMTVIFLINILALIALIVMARSFWVNYNLQLQSNLVLVEQTKQVSQSSSSEL